MTETALPEKMPGGAFLRLVEKPCRATRHCASSEEEPPRHGSRKITLKHTPANWRRQRGSYFLPFRLRGTFFARSTGA